jgi:transcriptional regulator with XRE-family HTH domain
MEDQSRDDAAYLKSLRQTAGLDLAELAALANLSAGQIRQLEDGGESLFYSPQIKTQSLRRVIHLLESPQPSGKPIKVQPVDLPPRTSSNVIEDIIRLSEKNFKGNVVSTPVRQPVNTAWMISLLVLVFVGGGSYLSWMSNRDIPQSVYNEWVEPLTRSADAANPSSVNVTVNNQNTPTAVAQTATSTTVVTSAVTAPAPAAVAAAPATLAAPAAVTGDLPATAAVPKTKAAPLAESAPAVAPVEKTKTLATPLPESATAERKTIKPPQESALADEKGVSDCSTIKSEALTANSVSPSKAGTYVYLQASKPVQICVEDGQKHRSVVSLEAGTGRSIHGSPPWTVASHELKSVQIYFQGSKVWLPSKADKRIVLNEQPVAP